MYNHLKNTMNYSLLEKAVNQSNLNKNKIAELSGISRTTLDSALRGADIKISTLEKISNVIGLNVSLLFDDGQPNNVTVTDGNAVAVNVNAPINAPITSRSVNEDLYIKSLLAEKDKMLAEKEKMIREKERTIQILLKSQVNQ